MKSAILFSIYIYIRVYIREIYTSFYIALNFALDIWNKANGQSNYWKLAYMSCFDITNTGISFSSYYSPSCTLSLIKAFGETSFDCHCTRFCNLRSRIINVRVVILIIVIIIVLIFLYAAYTGLLLLSLSLFLYYNIINIWS